jgi:hypothetical protein
VSVAPSARIDRLRPLTVGLEVFERSGGGGVFLFRNVHLKLFCFLKDLWSTTFKLLHKRLEEVLALLVNLRGWEGGRECECGLTIKA